MSAIAAHLESNTNNFDGDYCINYNPKDGNVNYYFKTPVTTITYADGGYSLFGERYFYDGVGDSGGLDEFSKLTTKPHASILIDTSTQHFFLPFPGASFPSSNRVSLSPNIRAKILRNALDGDRINGRFKFCFQ